MNILLAGANGQTGKILAERLVKSGYQVKGAIRKPEQVDGIRQIGAEPVVMDLTQPETFPQNLDGVDAVIFAAGSGGSAVEAVDRDGAISLIDAAKHANVGRFVMLSSIMVTLVSCCLEHNKSCLAHVTVRRWYRKAVNCTLHAE